jgi:hypothetical protein
MLMRWSHVSSDEYLTLTALSLPLIYAIVLTYLTKSPRPRQQT